MPPEDRRGTDVVLIADDVPENLSLLCDALDEADYMVLVANDGLSVLERMDKLIPDMILLDAVMPHIDGFETCRRIKANPTWAHVPVIFMTGLTDSENVVRGFAVGGVDYVTKPIVPDEVLARVSTHLRNARLMREARLPESEGAAAGGQLSELTQREMEVLEWLAYGKTNRDIGQILDTSPRTVSKHLEHIYLKLGVETRSAAASMWVRHRPRRVS